MLPTLEARPPRKLYPQTAMPIAQVINHTKGYPGMWYLGSPYSKFQLGIEAAWIGACKITGRFNAAGVAVYSPIVHSHPVAVYGGYDPYDYEIWMPLNEAMMGNAEGLIVAMMEGWRDSYGLGEEIAWFEKRRQPVLYLDVEGLV